MDITAQNVDEVTSDLQEFAQRVEALTERGDIRHPWPTLRILGRRNRERYWQRYLAYFLDPSKSHGFRDELLEEVLGVIEEKTDFSRDFLHPDWELVEVETEADGDEGRPDILIYQPNRWFVCFEMKVNASYDADQLRRYLGATEFGNLDVTEYDPERQFYIYIDTERPTDFPPDSDSNSQFKLVTWEEIAKTIDAVTAPPNGHRPVRSVEQMRDFRELISYKTNMDQDDSTYRKLKDEYIEHRDAIRAANEGGEEFVARNLAHEWVSAITTGDYQPGFWDESWRIHYRQDDDSPGWGQVYRNSWKQREELDIDVHFEHKPRWKHFLEGKFVFNLEIEGKTDGNDSIKDCWNEQRSVIRQQAPETMEICSPSPRNKYMLKSKDGAYEYTPGDPEAYFEALQRALEDNELVAEIVDNIVAALPFDNPNTVELGWYDGPHSDRR